VYREKGKPKMKKGLFDYLDHKKMVEIEKKGGVKIEVTKLYADGVQELISRIIKNEGFEELKIRYPSNMFFVNTERLQILQVEFLGLTKRHTLLEIGGEPIFRITLKEFSEKEKYQQEMETKTFMFSKEEIMLFFEVVRKGKVNPISHNYSASVEESLVTAEMLKYDIGGHLILGDLGSDYLTTFGNSISMQSLFQGQGG
jgi:hypothetical protein